MKTNLKFTTVIILTWLMLMMASPQSSFGQSPCVTDDFEDGVADEWTPLTPSRWQVSSDDGSLRYFLNTTNYDSPDGIRMGEISLSSSGPWGDFTLECLAKSADAAIGGEAADLCIAFGYQDEDSYYYINFNATPGLTQLHRIHDGNLVTLATYNQATFSDGNYHILRVERSGNQIFAFFDGIQLLAVNDSFFGTGQLGIGSYNDSGYFDDVQIAGDACPPSDPFTEMAATLTAVQQSSVAWGDYDNDGDLDILLTGRTGSLEPIAKIYRNDSGGNFIDINAPLTDVYDGAVAWGDYDNDGDLDILLTGTPDEITATAKIYRNDPAGSGRSFVEVPSSLAGVYRSAVAWGDYDNDGDLDILLTGDAPEGPNLGYKLKIYRNDQGNFVDLNLTFPGLIQGTAAWGDYDNDGDLDFLVTGLAEGIGASYVSKVYRNDSASWQDNFVDIAAPLTGVNAGTAAWGDFDNDGDLDILLAGLTSPGPPTAKIYRNDSGNLADAGISLAGVYDGSAAWGDFDNDGDLDILLTGVDAASVTKVYRNDGGNFTDMAATLTGVYSSSAAWGDHDNDGDLDMLLTGYTGTGQIAKIYRNDIGAANNTPNIPTNLAATIAGNTATLSWKQASDNETPSNGLTYNLRLGTTSNGIEIVAPMADRLEGTRRVPQLGNTNHRSSWSIQNLAPGTYYWSVQAIDNAFAGSPLSTRPLAKSTSASRASPGREVSAAVASWRA